MSRLPALDPSDAEPEVQAALDRLPPLAIFATVANAQGSFVNWLRFGGNCLDGRLFDPLLREMAILRVARLTPGAEYEWPSTCRSCSPWVARPSRLRRSESDELEADALGEDGRLVVRFATQVVLDATPDEPTFVAMSERFPTAEIVQLLLVIGQYMMVARVMATAQLEVDAVLGADVLASTQRRADPPA